MSLGGKQTQTQSIDPALKAASLEQLALAKQVGRLGFVPYKGATVAGLQPAQIGAMENTNAGLSAFGLNPSAIPMAGDFSPYEIYQQQLAQMAPGQRAFIDAMFIDPMTGMMAGAESAPQTSQVGFGAAKSYGNENSQNASERAERRAGGGNMTRTGGGTGAFGLPDPMSGRFAGTNLPGLAGSVVNKITGAMAPKTKPPAIKDTKKANTTKTTAKSPSKDSGARR